MNPITQLKKSLCSMASEAFAPGDGAKAKLALFYATISALSQAEAAINEFKKLGPTAPKQAEQALAKASRSAKEASRLHRELVNVMRREIKLKLDLGRGNGQDRGGLG